MSSPQTLPAAVFTSRIESVKTKTAGSLARWQRAQQSLAGGVSTALRRSMRPYPLYFRSGSGATVEDVDGNRYTDYGLAWGPLILGHSHPEVVEAIARQCQSSLTFGAQHDLEFEVAEKLKAIIPCGDLVCFANSGTEIVQVALRLARAATGRRRFVKFEGHYHGWDDSVLVSYQPSAEQIANADGRPVPVGAGQRGTDALVCSWNDRAAVERLFAENGPDIAAVICEPLLCNCFCIPAAEGFLQFLRDITERHGSLLIFDEVITGFRVHLQGAQGLYGTTPDLATYAKAVGAGTPLSVLAGKKAFMDLIGSGKVVHAGTLNGNPIALAAAQAALGVLSRPGTYEQLDRLGEKLRTGIEQLFRQHGYSVVTSGQGAVFHVSFMEHPARNYRDTMAADRQSYADFAAALLDEGVLLLQDGRWYLSTAHSEAEIDNTLAAVDRVLGTRL